MRVERPTRLKVGGRDYKIEDWNTRDCNRAGILGETDHELRTIKIDFSYGDGRAAETIVHEIFHCIDKVWVVEKEDSEERRVQCLEHGFCAFWRDNPALMRWLHTKLT